MSQFSSVERLSHILKVVHNKHYPSMEEIMEYLEEKDIQPTERTLQRDLKTLRDSCHINVIYSRSNNGYYIDKDSQFDFLEWMNVFELFNTSRIINETLIQSPKNLDYIDFDRSGRYINDDILSNVLKATLDRNIVQIKHQSYWNSNTKIVNLEPHLLKQYQNRWYVFGSIGSGEFRSYALDRISTIEITTQSFKPRLKNPKKAFDEIVGMVYSISDVQTVILSFDSFQGKYIKSQPLHTSQKIMNDDENEFRISIRVRPNYELEEQILKHGDRIRVLEPTWLKEKIRERLILAINNY